MLTKLPLLQKLSCKIKLYSLNNSRTKQLKLKISKLNSKTNGTLSHRKFLLIKSKFNKINKLQLEQNLRLMQLLLQPLKNLYKRLKQKQKQCQQQIKKLWKLMRCKEILIKVDQLLQQTLLNLIKRLKRLIKKH